MSQAKLRRSIIIANPHGFHMRPVTVFAQLASSFESDVTLRKSDQCVNGKSPLELMFLAAEQGAELELEVSGDDAETAIDQLAAVLGAPSVDDLP